MFVIHKYTVSPCDTIVNAFLYLISIHKVEFMVPYGRLARQPDFEGAVTQGRDYVLVDDFVGMGGTLANLRGFIEAQGGKVVAAVTLTGKPYSAKLALDAEQLQKLREKHGT